MMETKEMDNYIKRSDSRKTFLLRLYAGFKEILKNPIYGVILVILTISFGYVWTKRFSFIDFMSLSEFMTILYMYSVSFVLIMTYILTVLMYLKTLAVLTSRKDEMKLVKAFNDAKKEVSRPIRISKTISKSGIIKRKFYTDIPLDIWEEKTVQAHIETKMNEELIIPRFENGGKYKNDTRIIVMYTKSKKNIKKGNQVYDDKF